MTHNSESPSDRKILGIRFFAGTADQAVEAMLERGGLLVAPAAPALVELSRSPAYREALVNADLAIPDSTFMVLLWNLLHRRRLGRVSGLRYLRRLLDRPTVKTAGATFWIMASPQSARRNRVWLAEKGFQIADDHIHLAPIYGGTVDDPALVEKLDRLRPAHIILTLGGGNQERLGWYLKQHLGYRPAIHCLGSAIALLSGDQVRVPGWADSLGLNWVWRCLADPRRYVKRYWRALRLVGMMLRHGENLPTAP